LGKVEVLNGSKFYLLKMKEWHGVLKFLEPILTLFRLVAVGGIGYWLWDSVERRDSSNYLIVAVALILAGAFGNIIDSVFYGVFYDSHSQLHCFQNSLMAPIFTVK
jgi:lipoprotein signal peptidase